MKLAFSDDEGNVIGRVEGVSLTLDCERITAKVIQMGIERISTDKSASVELFKV